MVAKQNILFPKNQSFQDFGRETGTNIPWSLTIYLVKLKKNIQKKRQQVGKPTNNGGGSLYNFLFKGDFTNTKKHGVLITPLWLLKADSAKIPPSASETAGSFRCLQVSGTIEVWFADVFFANFL